MVWRILGKIVDFCDFRPISRDIGPAMLALERGHVQNFGLTGPKTAHSGGFWVTKLSGGQIWVVWRIFRKIVDFCDFQPKLTPGYPPENRWSPNVALYQHWSDWPKTGEVSFPEVL